MEKYLFTNVVLKQVFEANLLFNNLIYILFFTSGHENAAEILIRYGANVNITARSGETALHYAARLGN